MMARRIFFIGIGFYDYEHAIIAALERNGHQVEYSTEAPALYRYSKFGAAVRMLGVDGIIRRRFLRGVEDRVICAQPDILLIIKGEHIPEAWLSRLRARLPSAKFIMYQWDSLERVSNARLLLRHFDRVLTFDPSDAANNSKMEFRPLFFREGRAVETVIPVQPSSAVVFVGLLHSDRLSALRSITGMLRQTRTSHFIHAYTGKIEMLRHWFGPDRGFVSSRPIPYPRVVQLFRDAQVIIDLPHPLQRGLTVRSIEAVGLRKKLATTHTDIVNYDFYRSANIHVFRDGDWRIPQAFIEAPYDPVPEHIVQKYSLTTWADTVIEIDASKSSVLAGRDSLSQFRTDWALR